MKLWIDDVRPAPDGWYQCRSVNAAKEVFMANYGNIRAVSVDHDSGTYARWGGDYINFLKWLEEEEQTTGKKIVNFPIHIHSMNPVGVENMRAIIQRNGWKEI